MWAVANNGPDSWGAGLWSKYDWTRDSMGVYYCQSTYAADTESDALSAVSANSSDLDSGCGGFPWSEMSLISSDHDDHDDHDDHHRELCHDTDTHENYESTEEDCEAAGDIWLGDDHDEHDNHHDGGVCHNTDTHENYESNEEDCNAAGHVWMEENHHDLPEIMVDLIVHTLSFPEEMLCYDFSTHTVNFTILNQLDCENAGLMWTSADSGSGQGNDSQSEDNHHQVGAVVIQIEVEGDYGFATPNSVDLYVLMDENHDTHDGHQGHEDHDEDEHNEDDHNSGISSEDENFEYDPHSWLNPMAFKAQLEVVLQSLSETFPVGIDYFTDNTINYSSELDMIHNGFLDAFGVGGTCDEAGSDKIIITNHNAYSYIAVEYDIEIITIHGLDPEGEPSPADVANVVDTIEDRGINVLFVEEYTDSSSVNTIVEQTGVTLLTLYTMEIAPIDSSDNYLSMMTKNLDNIITGCGC